MSESEIERANEARQRLLDVANILGELGQDRAAAKVLKIADKLPRRRVQFEDGLYRIEGVPWERLAGQWSSTRYSQTEANDQDVLARYGLPVPIVEVDESQGVFEYGDIPTASSLQALLTHAGTSLSPPQILKPIDERRMP